MHRRIDVLIIDDERSVCDLLHEELSERGYACSEALDGVTALSKLAIQPFDVALVDIRLPGMSGIEVLREIRTHYPGTATVMVTALNDVDTAVEAMKLGASDYIVKPFELGRVAASIENAITTAADISLASKCTVEMDAIAFGVEQKREMIDRHSMFVTQQTVEIARQLEVPEKEIRNWTANRLRLNVERKKSLASAVQKVKQS